MSSASTGLASVGRLEYSPNFIQTISAADEALAALDGQGSFLSEREVEFPFLHYLDYLADWQGHIDSWGQDYVPPDETLVESIRGLLGRKQGIFLGEWTRATLFRRSG